MVWYEGPMDVGLRGWRRDVDGPRGDIGGGGGGGGEEGKRGIRGTVDV